MSNCHVFLEVKGTKEGRDLFYMGNKHSDPVQGVEMDLLFHQGVPVPPELLDTNTWLTWQLENWGCREVVNPRATVSDTELLYLFETDQYPGKWLEKISQIYNNLELYVEVINRGNKYCIKAAYMSGKEAYMEIERDFSPIYSSIHTKVFGNPPSDI